jgi:hypothetical protein
MKSTFALVLKRLSLVLFFLVSYLILHTSYFATANVQAAGCTFTVSSTTVPPHGSFSVTVTNANPGIQYIIIYDSSSFNTLRTVDSTGSFSTTVTLDQIFGANSPQAVN